MNMEAVQRPSAILINLLAPIDLPSEAQNNINPRDGVRYIDIILLLMNFLALDVSGRVPAEVLNCSARSYDELYALLSDLLSEARRGRGEGSTSHSEAPQAFNGGSPVIRSSENNNPALEDRVSMEHEENVDSPPEQHVSIDIPPVDEPDSYKKRDSSMISETTLAITAQVVGTLVSSAFSGSSHPSWTANLMAVTTVYGIVFNVLGIGLRHVKPKLSGVMAKLGAVFMASTIILALGLNVVPAVAWPAGTVACLLIAIGVAMS